MRFGEFIRERRLELGYSLRHFCDLAGLDFSNWSKVERERLPFTGGDEKLKEIAEVLQIEVGSTMWRRLESIAAIAARTIPSAVLEDDEIVELLPIFFRRANGELPSEDDLNRLISVLRNR